jgi:hypothetical protein
MFNMGERIREVQVFVVKMRGTKFAEWTFEQKSAFFLVLGLLLYNGTCLLVLSPHTHTHTHTHT